MLVVGGPNGSGKTTLALEYASETGFPYLGAGAIAESLNSGDPASVHLAAGRQFKKQVEDRISDQTSFAVGFPVPCLTSGESIANWLTIGCCCTMEKPQFKTLLPVRVIGLLFVPPLRTPHS